MGRASSPELNALREMWRWVVVNGTWHLRHFEPVPLPCWFGDNIPGIDECEGQIEGAHWLKRQRVEKTLERELWRGFDSPFDVETAIDLKHLAAWDPRNGVPACNKHHTRFDGHRMPSLVVVREHVPAHVEAFARDWGLEDELARKCPTMGEGI